MECKNCQLPLRTDYSFCSNCGAKIIRNRLTVKNLWYDFTERYFNLDNTFLITFWHLIVKPEVVVGGYIEGVRKKYLNPVSYIAIAITLSGITLFLMRKKLKSGIDLSQFAGGENLNNEVGQKIMSLTLDYNTFIFLLFIPVFAFAGWLSLNKRNYNFAEHFVTATYSLAQYSIISFPISIILLTFSPDKYFSLTWPMTLLMLGYGLYVINKLHSFKFINRIPRSLLYIMISAIGYFGTIILFYIILFITGEISLADFAPKK